MNKKGKSRLFVWLCVAMLVLATVGCSHVQTVENSGNPTASGEEMTEGTIEESVEDQPETDPVKETLSVRESVAESVRAKLEYELSEEAFIEIAEMLRYLETDRRVGNYTGISQNQKIEPGQYTFRVYVDLSDETLYTYRKWPIYYVWAESRQDLYSTDELSERGFCSRISKAYWWEIVGNHLNLDDYSESELVLLHEGTYIVEDTTEKIGYDFPEKGEVLTTFWLFALEMFYNDYEDHEQFRLSTCISDFTNYSSSWIFMDLHHNWSVSDSGYHFILDESGDLNDTRISYIIDSKIEYSAKNHEKDINDSIIVIDGTITKDWDDDFRTDNTVAWNENRMNGVCGSVLGAIGERYLEQNGTLVGTIRAKCYLTQINKKDSSGEGWVVFDGQKPFKINVKYKSRYSMGFSAYEYSIDESALSDGSFVEDYVLKMTVDLTTTCSMSESDEPENTEHINNAEEMNLHKGYVDELVQNKYCTADYDGDGLEDLFYYANEENSELCLCFGNGEQLSMGKPLNGLYWGCVTVGDVTGDGVEEMIYNNWIPGTREKIDYFGVWQKTDNGWIRIPINEGDTAENLKKVGRFENIYIRLERLNDQQLTITQMNTGTTNVLDIGSVAMKCVWLSEEVQSIDTLVRVTNIDLIKDNGSGQGGIGVFFRIGRADVTGMLMYKDDQWVIEDWNMTIIQ